jgi:hypothetical protein
LVLIYRLSGECLKNDLADKIFQKETGLMEKEPLFHFRIRVGEIEIEASGPEPYVKEVQSYAEQLVSSSLTRMRTMGAISPSQREPESGSGNEVPKTLDPSTSEILGKDESIAEFLEHLPSKTHQDKILAFGYFLEKNRSTDSFSVKEINDCYDEVKEAKSNTAQYFTILVKSGLIMKAKNQPPGSATQYVLTRKGEATMRDAMRSKSES